MNCLAWACASVVSAGGGGIVDLGSAPFGVKYIDATVTLGSWGRAPARVVALEENGYATDRAVRTRRSGGSLVVGLSRESLYHVAQRGPAGPQRAAGLSAGGRGPRG